MTIEGVTDDRRPFPTFTNVRAVPDMAAAYDELVNVAAGRAALYAHLLAAQVDRADDPADGLVRQRRSVDADGRAHEAGEQVRALVELEAREREHLARLTTDSVHSAVEALRERGVGDRARGVTTSAHTVRAFIDELGLDLADPAVQRAGRRAMLSGPRAVGMDCGDPDEQGPALTADEQARARRDDPSDST